MTRKRKTVRMLVEVSVPVGLPIAQARKEVRSLINNQCEYNGYVPGTFDEINMRVKKIGAAK